MTIGYDKPLYFLPFDHRGTFQKNMFGWSGTLTVEQTARIVSMKWAIKVVTTVRRGGRDRVGCIALGRGEDDTRVRHWLQTAATVPGFIGFAVGLASFWGPLTEWRDGQITRDAAVSEIARRYREWVSIFESARRASGAAVARVGRA